MRRSCTRRVSRHPPPPWPSAQPHVLVVVWRKPLSYVIAFSAQGAVDVTRRYVRKAERGNVRDRCPEPVLLYTLGEINVLRQAKLGEAEKARLRLEALQEQQELQRFVVSALVADFLSPPKEPATTRETGAGGPSGDKMTAVRARGAEDRKLCSPGARNGPPLDEREHHLEEEELPESPDNDARWRMAH